MVKETKKTFCDKNCHMAIRLSGMAYARSVTKQNRMWLNHTRRLLYSYKSSQGLVRTQVL